MSGSQAAARLGQLLTAQQGLDFTAALALESRAYSELLGGAEFRDWLARRGPLAGAPIPATPVIASRDGAVLTLTLNDLANRNAISAPMRDALFDQLRNALDDPTRPRVLINGAGKCFSVGGHLPEFGTARDLQAAHRIRMARSCALLIDRLGTRVETHFHGGVIGSGLEIFAAGRCLARADSWFQLPEIGIGLIPGAGGTVTVTRRIGRERAVAMMLAGSRIRAAQALAWGLIDGIMA